MDRFGRCGADETAIAAGDSSDRGGRAGDDRQHRRTSSRSGPSRKTPTLHKLFEGGSFTFYAQTIPIAITLPSHTSMLTGVSMEKHGVTWNDERYVKNPVYTKATTLFEVAKKYGMSTSIVAGKSKFISIAKPGSVDWYFSPDDAKTTDDDVLQAAVKIVQEHKPQVMFVHFPGADTAGHASGWASPQQFAAIENIDQDLGKLMDQLVVSRLFESTVVIVTADHGGSGKQHGADDPRSLYIPWIANGPGVRKNFDLTSLRELTVNTTDTFATACFLMGFELPPETEGKPIYQMVEGYELLRPATVPAGGRECPAIEFCNSRATNVLLFNRSFIRKECVYDNHHPHQPNCSTVPRD